MFSIWPSRLKNNSEGIASAPPKRLEGKKCFKCHYCGNSQADYPNWRTLIIGELEELQAIKEEASEEEFE